jgi:hypothetical protein
MNTTDLNLELAVNAVALSNTFHRDPRYTAFYKAHSDALGGFPGVWRFLAEVAAEFTRIDAQTEWDGEFVSAIDHLVEIIYEENSIAIGRAAGWCEQAILNARNED